MYIQNNIILVRVKGLAFSSESSHYRFLYLAIFVSFNKVPCENTVKVIAQLGSDIFSYVY